MLLYVLQTLWYERHRYFPGVLAVGFSALLINLQCGLLLGLFSITSLPVDTSGAHIWVGGQDVLSVDLGRPIPESFLSRLASQPEVERTEMYIQGFTYWTKPRGGAELCMVVGARLEADSLGFLAGFPVSLRNRMTEPDAIVVDESDLGRLGLEGIGDSGEVIGRKVRVVGLTNGLKAFAGPYVFCSLRTAAQLLRFGPDQTTYVLGTCRDPEDAPRVVERLKGYEDMTTFTRDGFSLRTRMHWLTTTRAGLALGYAAMLGLMVGAVVTMQTLYAATAASFAEYATLIALGIPHWRMSSMVLGQAFWVGMTGILLAIPCDFAFAAIADFLGIPVYLPWWLLLSGSLITLLTAMVSGLVALRSFNNIEVMSLLRA